MAQFNDTFLKVCRGEPAPYTPVWFMRQAGRYQPEYRKIRESYSLFGICQNPEVCAEVTHLPIKQHGVDAAILFSDITIPFHGLGVKFEIKENVGPVTETPIREEKDIRSLKDFYPEKDIPYVGESVKLLKEQLSVPLIGFAGAPFTLASYLVEGGPSKRFIEVKKMMYAHPERWEQLMNHLTETVYRHASFQAECGADAIQIFDSWVGNLSEWDYEQFVKPWMKDLFSRLKPYNLPLIHFGVGTLHLLGPMKEAGSTVTGIDWRTTFRDAENRLGSDQIIQGNLDPVTLLGPWEEIEKRAQNIIKEAPFNRHIFNLGHGVLPQTPGENLQKLTKFVQQKTAKLNTLNNE